MILMACRLAVVAGLEIRMLHRVHVGVSWPGNWLQLIHPLKHGFEAYLML
jgi:hypothetical protein